MRVHPLSLNPNIGGIHSNFSEQKKHIPDSVMKKLRRTFWNCHSILMQMWRWKIRKDSFIVVKKGTGDGEDEQSNVDTWRYMLLASTMLELATMVFVDGELIVMVLKDDHGRGEFDNGSRGVWRDIELLLVP
ncbi:hypothetical protein RDI58_014896 [Solanum bulbocastanum]|uniref:Uncharacterized protein n=1 Tax=Solanum bulbocastanum TaxID=147425 RepID=A0AAN8YCC4_SOLBU